MKIIIVTLMFIVLEIMTILTIAMNDDNDQVDDNNVGGHGMM